MSSEAQANDTWRRKVLGALRRPDWFCGVSDGSAPGSSMLALANVWRYRRVLLSALLDQRFQGSFESVRHVLCQSGALAEFQGTFPPSIKPLQKEYRLKNFAVRLISDYASSTAAWPASSGNPSDSQSDLAIETKLWVQIGGERCEMVSRTTNGLAYSLCPARNRGNAGRTEWGVFWTPANGEILWADIDVFQIQLQLHNQLDESLVVLISQVNIESWDSSEFGVQCDVSKNHFAQRDIMVLASAPTTVIDLPCICPQTLSQAPPFYSEYDLDCRAQSIQLCKHLLANNEYYCKAIAIQQLEHKYMCHPGWIPVGDVALVRQAIAELF